MMQSHDMDDEVIVKDSPLYDYMQMMHHEGFAAKSEAGFDAIDPTVLHHPHDATDRIHAIQAELLDSQNAEGKVDLIKHLMMSSCLLEEHYIYLNSYIEAYHPQLGASLTKVSSQPENTYLWKGSLLALLVSCAAVGSLISRRLSLCPYSGACAGITLAFGIHSLRLQSSDPVNYINTHRGREILSILDRMDRFESLWLSFQRFHQEISLVSRGAVLVTKGASLSTLSGPDHGQQTLPVRRVIYLALRDNIQSLSSDLTLMHQFNPNLRAQGPLVYPAYDIDKNFSFSLLKEMHSGLHLLMSQWITSITLLLIQSKIRSLDVMPVLKGITFLESAERHFKFHKLLLDGHFETEPSSNASHLIKLDKREQAVHSLYLHSRELLRHVKSLSPDQVRNNQADETYMLIKQHLDDCKTCFETAWKKDIPKTERMPNRLEITQNSTPSQLLDMDEPVIDQVFVTTGLEYEGLDGTEEDGDQECQSAKLKMEYERYLMKELKNVISELARERVIREAKLQQSTDLTSAQISQITQDIIESRDIKSLVQTAAADLQIDHTQQLQSESNSLRKGDKFSLSSNKYSQNLDEACSSKMKPYYADMKSIASAVAQQFKVTQEDEITFGSESSDDESLEELHTS